MAAILIPDNVISCNGVSINCYMLTGHNPNKISLPSVRKGDCIGVTIHNTNRVNISANTTQAEQYTRATVNRNMGTVRVHFYVDDKCAWQNLPLNCQSWHAGQSGKADKNGSEKGNESTISIECIMGGSGDEKDIKARDNAARLAAHLLDSYGGELYTHNYWCNVRNGRTGTVDELNMLDDEYKNCPVFIRPKWAEFKGLVESYRKSQTGQARYFVQVGAFADRENAENYLAEVKKDYPGAFIKAFE